MAEPVNVLLVGLNSAVIDETSRQLSDFSQVQFFSATNIDEVRAAFAQARIDHVISGSGLELATRLEIIREIFTLSDATTVHVKDVASGKDGYLPFIRAVLHGLVDNHAG